MPWHNRIHPHAREVGSRRHYAGWVEPLRVIYDHELVLYFEAGFRVDVEEEVFACPPGSFIIIPPGRLHASGLAGAGPGTRCWAHFDWTWRPPDPGGPLFTFHPAQPSAERMRPAPAWVPRRVLHGAIAHPARARELHRRLQQRWQRGLPRERGLCRGVLLELLLELLLEPATGEEDGAPTATAAARLAARARRLLEAAAETPLARMPSLEAVLQELGCSYEHACRVFRTAYGVPPLAYVNSLRLERARLLLVDTDWNVTRIAREAGFSSISHFCRLFRRATAATPSGYRRLVCARAGVAGQARSTTAGDSHAHGEDGQQTVPGVPPSTRKDSPPRLLKQ